MMCLNGILFSMKTPQGTMVVAAGMYKETRVQTTIQGLIAVVGGIIGAYLWGLDGVLAGAVLSNLYRTIDLVLFAPKNIVHTKPTKSIRRVVRNMGLFFLAVILSVVLEFNPSNYIEWTILAVIYSLIIFSIVVLVNYILDRQSFKNVLQRMKNLVGKKHNE